jgi:hypothetical protein
MFNRGYPIFGEIKGHPSRWRENERAQALERSVNWIDDQIHRSDAAADDRPYFAGVAGRLPVAGIEVELDVYAVKEGSFLGARHDKLDAQFDPVD